MTKNNITLENVHLHYDAVAYKERSIKTLLTSFFRSKNAPEIGSIHALKGISLTISAGERIGLMGHNGAGKSTFLKALAGIYPISSGTLTVSGDVRALLDLSLGFEPDATGRENILYRGLLMGLTPKFMKTKTEEIVEFAELGEFINYPIKTYSAGMLVRLAFAISTSVGGDVLLLDEVLGAGDARFMEKARTRINGLIDAAEILVLASHDFNSLKQFCTRGLVFDKGMIAFDGDIGEAVNFCKTLQGVS